MPALFANIISHGKATLREIEEYYSFYDVLNLHEVLQTNSYNEWYAAKQAETKHKKAK